ncbi:rab geranylgeranyltransferase, beta subunit [Babesia caballi]|uniref:Geranylgeranyl transferase type II subunit beta n=1 Tax=Babesia caballi TaxID=5871 RepID=A0AAV4M4L2_BABCB|nr:rab geranylgeranyltransferase, beta subunit [Babesia caballi]
MDTERRDKILRGIHDYFDKFLKNGLLLLEDTETMRVAVFKRRKAYDAHLLKGMYWAVFSLHLLYKKYGIATPERLEHAAKPVVHESLFRYEVGADDGFENINYRPVLRESNATVVRETTVLSYSGMEEAINAMLARPTFNRSEDSSSQELEAFSCESNEELETHMLKGDEVEQLLEYLKSCQREFVYKDNSYLGFSNSDDRRRFFSNVSSTLMAVNTYRVIADNFKAREIATMLKHMTWMYQSEELLAFIQLLYVPGEGFYRSKLRPLVPKSSDIRDTATAVLATSVVLRLTGFQNEAYQEKIYEWVNVKEVYEHVMKHFNEDGGICLTPGTESHCGAAFCAIATLTVIGKLLEVPRQKLIDLRSWLLQRISASGGVSGRVGKAEDVCYAFWLMMTLAMLNKCGVHCQVGRGQEIIRFIESCQSPSGGITSYPVEGEAPKRPDPFHSFAALMTIALVDEEREHSDISVLQMLI